MRETLDKKIQQTKMVLGYRINQTQGIAAGSALVIIDDTKKVPLMQEKLKAFAACVRGDGGESCLKGK